MTTSDIKIINNVNPLANADYIIKALENTSEFNNVKTNGSVVINVIDVSIFLTSRPSMWKAQVTLEIMDRLEIYAILHKNEDWYLSEMIVYGSLFKESEEYKKAVANFQRAFESVIKKHADEILNVIKERYMNYPNTMQQFIELTKGAGKKQKLLLTELERQGIISLDKETGLWMRGALNCKYAKNLLLPTDKTIQEQIDDLEHNVFRLEREAKTLGVQLNGQARKRLNELYEKRNLIYSI